MAKRRVCSFSDKNNRDVDLRRYESLIINAVNKVVAGKNPKVYEHCFSTDELTHGEAVKLGLELASIEELAQYGKSVTTFRLFDGKIQNTDTKEKPKGGHFYK